jgi:hypothetical protein
MQIAGMIAISVNPIHTSGSVHELMEPISFSFVRDFCRDMTPRQNSLSGVIICPAYWRTAVKGELLHLYIPNLESHKPKVNNVNAVTGYSPVSGFNRKALKNKRTGKRHTKGILLAGAGRCML